MTLQEAERRLEDAIKNGTADNVNYWRGYRDALMAAEPAPSAPLTMEQLREMDGEPVWVVGANDEDINGNGYAVVHIWHEESAQVSWPGDANEQEPLIENYGKTWIAYRRKPKKPVLIPSEWDAPDWAEHIQSRFLRAE